MNLRTKRIIAAAILAVLLLTFVGAVYGMIDGPASCCAAPRWTQTPTKVIDAPRWTRTPTPIAPINAAPRWTATPETVDDAPRWTQTPAPITDAPKGKR